MLSVIEDYLSGVAAGWKGTLTDWCDLEAGFRDADYLLTVPGGCVSALRLEGLTRLYSDAEIPQLFRQVWPALAGATALHDLEMVYVRDPERGEQAVAANTAHLAQRAALAGITPLARIYDDWNAGPWLDEAVYAALWTHPRVLTRAEQRRDNRDYRQRVRVGGAFRYTQHPFRAYQQLIHTHRAAFTAFATQLRHAPLAVTPLTGAGILRTLKGLINPHQARWEPHLIGDPIAANVAFPGPTSAFWLPLRDQLFDLDGERVSRVLCRVGDRWYASVRMTLLMRRIERFSSLRIDHEVPWRIRFHITAWPLALKLHYALNRLLAGVMNWPTHERNNLVVKATHELQPLIEADETRVLRVVATTWGDSELAIRLRLEKLISGLQHWGLSTVKPIQDDPLEGVLSSLPALRAGSAGDPLIAPKHYTVCLPIDTPASVFTRGLAMRTPQGRPWFYEPLSDRQAAWVTLYTGIPGQGKSVLMAAENLTFLCLSGELPLFSHIELNPSARGLFELVRALAEPATKSLILYRRLRASPEDAINPFSTYLGCRQPLPYHRESLIQLLMCLSYSFDATAPEKNTTELVTMLVEELYTHYLDNDHGNPKRYTPGLNPLLDDHLARQGLHPATFFEAADALFAVGDVEGAEWAHEQAMPLLSDAAVLLKQSHRIDAQFGGARTADGQPLVDYVHQQWIAALHLFPQLQAPTRVRLGQARVVGFDLQEVAPTSFSERERRVTTVVYLLARQLAARNIFLRPEYAVDFAPPYQAWARQVIQAAYASPKRMSYDEVQIFQGIEAAEKQLVMDAAVERKHNWSLAFATQLLQFLPQALIELATSRFLVGEQSPPAMDTVDALFHLTEGEKAVLRDRLRAPTPAGSSLLAILSTRDHGLLIEHLYYPCPPRLLWALATSRDNEIIQRRVRDRLDDLAALDALAGRFPEGSAKARLDFLLREYPERTRAELIQDIADSVVAYHWEKAHVDAATCV